MEHVGIRELYATGRSMGIDTVGMTPEEVRRVIDTIRMTPEEVRHAIGVKDESSCEDSPENE